MKAIQLFLLAITINAACAGADSKTRTASPSSVAVKGVEELKFEEFFEYPVGPAGLTFSDKLKALNGRNVRIVGYMVSQEKTARGSFILAPLPIQLHEEHYGLADDLPASALFVFNPGTSTAPIQYRPGLIVVTGALEIGNREEADGRISAVRLTLKSPPRELKPKAKTSRTPARRVRK